MKPEIHPAYHPRTYPLVVVDVSAESHPFWTGANRVLDNAGRVEKFRRRYGLRTGRAERHG